MKWSPPPGGWKPPDKLPDFDALRNPGFPQLTPATIEITGEYNPVDIHGVTLTLTKQQAQRLSSMFENMMILDAFETLVKTNHDRMKAQGFWGPLNDGTPEKIPNVGEKLMLMVTELAEAFEAVRKGKDGKDGKDGELKPPTKPGPVKVG